ncbi:MFS transporter [Virgibacillus necropolis]|uniref:MFS transporter n=1 Tax=Virgibacillus necropolis TaxID=163877 RepID=A0A221MEQ5_9BACI|nr:MFS transporter [Virgibacillus necropolis]ASN06153.1 MFS transporter [Virgibacillus necropolis]
MEEKSIRKSFHILCIGVTFVVFAEASGLVAYPKMLENFDLSTGYAVWMQLGFALGLTGFQPLFGWLGDYFNQKMVIILGSILLTIGSSLVALAPFFWVLVVGMFIKGVAGAAVIPAGFTYVGKFFNDEQRGKALGIFGFYSVIGGVLGPVISGVFVDSLGWTSIFWFCALLGIVSFLLFFTGVPKVQGKKSGSFDFLGVIFVLLTLIGILTIPTFINSYGISSWMWLPPFGVFVIAFLLLIVVEKKQKDPLVDINYAANRNFWVTSIISVLLFVTFSSVMYLLTFFVQGVQEKSSTIVGLLQMALFATMAVANLLSGRWMSRLSARFMIGLSIVLLVGGSGMLIAVTVETSFLYLLISMCLIGIGIGFAGPATRAVVLSKADPSRLGAITFTYTMIENTAQRVGASFAIVTYALFVAGGNAVSALSSTALILTILTAMSFIFLYLIPKKVKGFQGVTESAQKVEVDTTEYDMSSTK